MYTLLLLALAVLLIVLNALFVAAEFAFVRVRRTRLEILASEGDRRARSALFGLEHLNAYLSVCQLGITLASLGLGWIGEPAVAALIRPVLEMFSITKPALVSSLSIAVGFAIITLLHVVFGELMPKTVSIRRAESAVLLLARPMRLFHILWLPVVTVLNGISNVLLRLAGIRGTAALEHAHSPEELRMLIFDSSREGQLDQGEGRMLDNIFSFSKKTARDVMLHRTDAVALDVENSPETAVDITKRCGHTRFPVYKHNRDNIIGFIHTRDLLLSDTCPNLDGMVRTPLYAQETIHLDKLLQRMQNERQQFCVVVDEYGIWQGILTMEDVVEAIVGDIQDEFDNETPHVVPQSDGSFLVAADLSLDDLSRHMPLHCDRATDLYKILAAHIFEHLGRIPQIGDSVLLCGRRVVVVGMDRHRVRRVRITPMPEHAGHGTAQSKDSPASR
ncbi:MAG: hemolysin family protein [Deltaproteobacteria bacterium]|nr:hemolysin family protein [Deltaproteobacteria bacterium]